MCLILLPSCSTKQVQEEPLNKINHGKISENDITDYDREAKLDRYKNAENKQSQAYHIPKTSYTQKHEHNTKTRNSPNNALVNVKQLDIIQSRSRLDWSNEDAIDEKAGLLRSAQNNIPYNGTHASRKYRPVNYPYEPIRPNPSLWPDESQSSSLFRDFRAFQPMDIITIIINEVSEGKKNADTDTKSESSILSGIAKFFGIESSKWKANNAGIDPSKLIDMSTKTNFKGEGETNRSGKMTAQISAKIMEVLPNGLLRIEGHKNLTLNREEEVIVVKGLVRPNDVSALNQVQSNRIADLEIAFFGQGVIGDEQSPGWIYHWLRVLWPF